ncbi:MAG: hypothetical protein JSR17_04720 [Proteobacteria bacterium]|nr:hypothetical protein [Pseudomonadota bacterium]
MPNPIKEAENEVKDAKAKLKEAKNALEKQEKVEQSKSYIQRALLDDNDKEPAPSIALRRQVADAKNKLTAAENNLKSKKAEQNPSYMGTIEAAADVGHAPKETGRTRIAASIGAHRKEEPSKYKPGKS